MLINDDDVLNQWFRKGRRGVTEEIALTLMVTISVVLNVILLMNYIIAWTKGF